jgi:hypothetical protein
MIEPLFLIVLAVIVIAAPAHAAIKFARKANSQKELIIELPITDALIATLPRECVEFAATQHFTLIGAFAYESAVTFVFHQVDKPAMLRAMVVIIIRTLRVTDFLTEFSLVSTLTTTQGTGLGMFPRVKGDFSQGFPRAPLPELFRRHLEAESYLIENGKVECGPLVMPLKERMERSIRVQALLVRQTSLYWLKAVYWFWFKRFIVANRPIAPKSHGK